MHKGLTQWKGEVADGLPKLARCLCYIHVPDCCEHFLLSQELCTYHIAQVCIFPHTGYLLHVPFHNRNIKSSNFVAVHPSILEVPKLINQAKGQLPDCCIPLVR